MGKQLVLLGSTGSIGTQTLEVAPRLGWTVTALAAHRSVELMERQIRQFHPKLAALYDEKAAAELRIRVADLPVRVLSGNGGLCELASLPEADMVLNAVVGMVGLEPTLAALNAGRTVALANKETLVAGGEVVMQAARKAGVKLLPVDSEHSAIFQCLQGTHTGPWAPPEPTDGRGLHRLILTASGGPFFGYTAEQLRRVTPEEALRHPNWSMGPKITVDSATMMNKGLELIEARWLFSVPPEKIDVVIHRESVVHSLIEYEDRSVMAQLGVPDMRVPIQYALTWPNRAPSTVPALDLAAFAKLTFFAPDTEVFPGIELCRRALQQGGTYPAAVNAANEEANALFRAGKIPFDAISRLAAGMLEKPFPAAESVEAVLAADAEARRRVSEQVG